MTLNNVSTHIPVHIQYKQSNNSATAAAFVAVALSATDDIQQSMAY